MRRIAGNHRLTFSKLYKSPTIVAQHHYEQPKAPGVLLVGYDHCRLHSGKYFDQTGQAGFYSTSSNKTQNKTNVNVGALDRWSLERDGALKFEKNEKKLKFNLVHFLKEI